MEPASKVLLNFVPRCNQWVPLSLVSPRNARLSTPNPISGHGVDDVSLVSPDRGALNVSCLIFWVRCGKAVRASLAGDQRIAVSTYAVDTSSPPCTRGNGNHNSQIFLSGMSPA
jgi:hypothetical protein